MPSGYRIHSGKVHIPSSWFGSGRFLTSMCGRDMPETVRFGEWEPGLLCDRCARRLRFKVEHIEELLAAWARREAST